MAQAMAAKQGAAVGDAAERNAVVVVSVFASGRLEHFRSRFVGREPRGLWIESVEAVQSWLKELLASQAPLAVSYNEPDQRISFITTVAQLDTRHRVDESGNVGAVLVRLPKEFRAMPRRSNGAAAPA